VSLSRQHSTRGVHTTPHQRCRHEHGTAPHRARALHSTRHKCCYTLHFATLVCTTHHTSAVGTPSARPRPAMSVCPEHKNSGAPQRRSKLQLRKRTASTAGVSATHSAKTGRLHEQALAVPHHRAAMHHFTSPRMEEVAAHGNTLQHTATAATILPPYPGVGLTNEGDTCYINCILQACYHSPPLRAALCALPSSSASAPPPLMGTLARCFVAMDCVRAGLFVCRACRWC